jgi:hypothetical protein
MPPKPGSNKVSGTCYLQHYSGSSAKNECFLLTLFSPNDCHMHLIIEITETHEYFIQAQEKVEQELRKLTRLDGNKTCVDCPEKVLQFH